MDQLLKLKESTGPPILLLKKPPRPPFPEMYASAYPMGVQMPRITSAPFLTSYPLPTSLAAGQRSTLLPQSQSSIPLLKFTDLSILHITAIKLGNGATGGAILRALLNILGPLLRHLPRSTSSKRSILL